MNILFVITNSALNRVMNTGLENLAWALSIEGMNVHVLSGGYSPESPMISYPDGVTYHFTDRDGVNPVSFIDRYKEIISKNNIDCVVGWILNISYISCLRESEGISFISNQGQMAMRSVFLRYFKMAFLRRVPVLDAAKTICAIKKFPKRAGAVVSISKAVQRSCIKVYRLDGDQCVVIPRGVDTSFFSPCEKIDVGQGVKLLFAGNVIPGKGMDDLTAALQFVHKPTTLTLCGNANLNYVNSLVDKVNAFEMGHQVLYMGPLSASQLVEQYQACNVFVFPSHAEGLGKVLLEAMSCGCAVVCSDIDVFREVVTDGHDGLMVPVRSPKLLAEAIDKFAADDGFRAACGENARRRVKKGFSRRSEVVSWIALMEGVRFRDQEQYTGR